MAAKIRKTFKYPTEDDVSQDSRDEMDEEEQDQLISSLQSQSKSSNALYTLIFAGLPLMISPLYIYYIVFSGTTPARLKLLCLLAFTSLVASSFTMLFLSTLGVLEVASNARARLDLRQRQTSRRIFENNSNQNDATSGLLTKIVDKLDDIRLDLDTDGPLLKFLPILNAVICVMLALSAWILKGQNLRDVSEFMGLYLLLPAVMLIMTTIARKSIDDEEQDLKELTSMKYGYKGA